MSLPWTHGSLMMANFNSRTKDDPALYIDPQMLDLQNTGSWIAEHGQQPISVADALSRARLERVAVSKNATLTLSHQVDLSNVDQSPLRNPEVGVDPFVTPHPQISAITPAVVHGSGSPTMPTGPQELVDVAMRPVIPTNCSTPHAPVHNVVEPRFEDNALLLRALARPRARTYLSPGQLQRQGAVARKGQMLTPTSGLLPHDTLLSPAALFSERPYQAGNRSISNAITQPSTPISFLYPGANSDPSTPASIPRAAGPYHCDTEGCKERTVAFNTMSDLKKHQRKHLSMEERPHACPDCGRRFQYPKDVRRHRKAKVHSHIGGEEVVCHVCKKPLSRGDNLARHLATQHNIADTPSMFSESSAGSPLSFSTPSFSEGAYSYPSPASTGRSAPSLMPARTSCYSMQWMRPYNDSFIDGSPRTPPSSAPMARWRTN